MSTQTTAANSLFKETKDAKKLASEKLSDQIEKDRQANLQIQATKTSRLRDQRLAKEAADKAAGTPRSKKGA
jgi:hypothetical protein